MAKKSSESTKDAAAKTATPKAAVKKTAVKAAAPKAETASKSGTPKAAPKKAASPAAPQAAAPKAAAPKAAAPKKAAAKKAPLIKLSESMRTILDKINGAAEPGYIGEKKEAKTIESLATKKLIKKGAKDKAGKVPYSLTKLGEKHVATGSPEKSPAGA